MALGGVISFDRDILTANFFEMDNFLTRSWEGVLALAQLPGSLCQDQTIIEGCLFVFYYLVPGHRQWHIDGGRQAIRKFTLWLLLLVFIGTLQTSVERGHAWIVVCDVAHGILIEDVLVELFWLLVGCHGLRQLWHRCLLAIIQGVRWTVEG